MERASNPAGAWLRGAALLCVLATLVCGLAGAQEARVAARISSGVVKLGSDARLLIEVRDAQSAQLGDLPQVEGLVLQPPGAPSSLRSTEVFNGRAKTTVQLTWSVPVVASKPGRYTIPAIEVRTPSGQLMTRPVVFEVVQDVEGEDFGWLTIDAPREVHAGQPFTLDILVGFDTTLVASINYANLTLPWYGTIGGMVELPLPDSGARAANQINLNGDQVISVEEGGERTRDGRAFRTLRWRRRFLASDPGVLELSTSHFEFGQMARSFFGLDPSQKKTMYKRLEPVAIKVLAVPEAGRPIDWSGAVGRVEARAAADRRAVDAGDSIKLTIDWSGDANLDFFEPPDLARLAGFEKFRVYGKTDRKSAERRTVVYDLAPVDPALKEIPPVPLSVYDTERRAYATVETRPIPIQVRALKNAVALQETAVQREFEADVRDIEVAPRDSRDPWAPSSTTVLLGLGLVLAAGGRVRRVLLGDDDPWAPVVRRRRRALRDLRAVLPSRLDNRGRYSALCEFLAARSGESATAWRGRDVRSWAAERRQGAGWAPSPLLEAELAECLCACERASWDQGAGPDDARILAVAGRVCEEGLQ